MSISVKNLGDLSSDVKNVVKFMLLDSGQLFFAKVQWHKNIFEKAAADNIGKNVIAAGTVPKSISTATLDGSHWGDWKSTGFNIVTDQSLRSDIKESLLSFEAEIDALYNVDTSSTVLKSTN